MKNLFKYFKRFWKREMRYPIIQEVLIHEDCLECFVRTYVGDRLVHLTEVDTDTDDLGEDIDKVMQRDWRSAEVFREVVYGC